MQIHIEPAVTTKTVKGSPIPDPTLDPSPQAGRDRGWGDAFTAISLYRFMINKPVINFEPVQVGGIPVDNKLALLYTND
jgi:hypothetical protein